MLWALASCACAAPEHAPQLLVAVQSAHERGALDSRSFITFILTLTLEAALPPAGRSQADTRSDAAAQRNAGPGDELESRASDRAGGSAPADRETAARRGAWASCVAALVRLVVGANGGKARAALQAFCEQILRADANGADAADHHQTVDVGKAGAARADAGAANAARPLQLHGVARTAERRHTAALILGILDSARAVR